LSEQGNEQMARTRESSGRPLRRPTLAPLLRLVSGLDPAETNALMSGWSDEAAAEVIELARIHQVEAWLAGCAPAEQECWHQLHAQRQRFAAARMRDGVEIDAFAEVMKTLDTPWAVLKGAALARTVYPRPQLRFGVDLDVLVPAPSVLDVVTELQARGYELLDLNWPLMLATRPGELKVRSARGVLIDLHWSIVNDARVRSHFKMRTDELLARRRVFDDGMAALSDVDQFLHVAVHAALSGGNRLSWLMDIGLSALAVTDWPAVTRRSSEAGIGPLLRVMLDRTTRYLRLGECADARPARNRSAWPVISQLVDRISPLRPDYDRPALNRSLARSTRRTAFSSMAELARHGSLWLRSGAPRAVDDREWLDPASANSAMYAVDDPAARSRFFQQIAEDA